MAVYHLFSEQKIPQQIDVVWDFISNPHNLRSITPPSMGFEITTKELEDKIYSGMIISYTLKPLLGIKTLWLTEITHVREREYFVDEQRVGPYKLWHHQHKLTDMGDHVMMSDMITYKPPMGMIGSLANTLMIKKRLHGIFEYRRKMLENKFGIVL
jgi:ligand-binding SRPBCC domain-containing protein